MDFPTLVKDVGFPLTLLGFTIVSIFRLLVAMQVSRGEMVTAEATGVRAEAEVIAAASKLALRSQEFSIEQSEKLDAALRLIAGLSVDVERLKAQVEEIRRDGKEKDATIVTLQTQVKSLQDELGSMRTQLEQERQEKDDLRRVKEQLLSHIRSLEGQLKLLVERMKQVMDTPTLQALAKEIERMDLSKELLNETQITVI